ncbi:hypothetical protein RIF29_07406 [Crotalaria pallida]|uniref:Uncharacterized protein n=1 Tax=Crotalaria pallida TaxID=3830 RepID=A0AAN9PBU4_CROPI
MEYAEEDSKLQQAEEVKDHDHDEEALSLCDLPLNENSISSKRNSLDDKSFKRIIVGSSQLQDDDSNELFEFFKGFSSIDSSSSSTTDMCPADDIISCGKLIPLKDKDKNILTQQPMKSPQPPPQPSNFRKRSESLPSVNRSNSVSGGRLMMRNSRSMDYQRLHDDVIPPAREFDRNLSLRSSVVMSEKKAVKPRWFSIMFGTIMKVPTEMELNDIKNRQVRMNPSPTMFPATNHGGKVAVNRCSGKVSWRILQALSCKDESSVAVTTSFPVAQASS